jgi:hypothetical protein
MSSLDPSSPAFTSLARRRSAPERILSIEDPAAKIISAPHAGWMSAVLSDSITAADKS